MKPKLIFMGSSAIALPALNYLADQADSLEFAAVYTQPDRPSGRGKKCKPNAIKQWALDREIPVFQPEKLDEATVAHVQECQPCLVLVMAYGHILRRRLIDAPALGTFNLHASILPKYRGASPIEAAIASGDEETGVTLMRMVRRLDAGPIVDIERFPIDRLETGESAARKISEACPPLLERNLPAMLRGEVSVREQDDAAATFTRKLEKIDGALDFAASAEELARRINALYPWPGCFVQQGEQRIKLGLADWADEDPGADPGMVIGADERALRVATGRGTLLLLALQRPGGRMLPAAEFLRGLPFPAGTKFASQPMPPLVARTPFPVRQG